MSAALKAESDGPFPLSWWDEDEGDVLWWAWIDGEWLSESPYVGSPLDCGHTVEIRSSDRPDMRTIRYVGGWPGYHTHWTRIRQPPPPAEEGK